MRKNSKKWRKIWCKALVRRNVVVAWPDRDHDETLLFFSYFFNVINNKNIYYFSFFSSSRIRTFYFCVVCFHPGSQQQHLSNPSSRNQILASIQQKEITNAQHMHRAFYFYFLISDVMEILILYQDTYPMTTFIGTHLNHSIIIIVLLTILRNHIWISFIFQASTSNNTTTATANTVNRWFDPGCCCYRWRYYGWWGCIICINMLP